MTKPKDINDFYSKMAGVMGRKIKPLKPVTDSKSLEYLGYSFPTLKHRYALFVNVYTAYGEHIEQLTNWEDCTYEEMVEKRDNYWDKNAEPFILAQPIKEGK